MNEKREARGGSLPYNPYPTNLMSLHAAQGLYSCTDGPVHLTQSQCGETKFRTRSSLESKPIIRYWIPKSGSYASFNADLGLVVQVGNSGLGRRRGSSKALRPDMQPTRATSQKSSRRFLLPTCYRLQPGFNINPKMSSTKV